MLIDFAIESGPILRIGVFGDIVGRSGRMAFIERIAGLRRRFALDFGKTPPAASASRRAFASNCLTPGLMF